MHTLKNIVFLILFSIFALFLLLFLGPKQNIYWEQVVNPAANLSLAQIDDYLVAQESQFSDILPGQHKQVVWASDSLTQTEYSIIYIHGFSASLGEMRPVPDRIAEELRANLFYTRLAGHGRPGEAMGDIHVMDWVADLEEALTIGRLTGEKVIVMGTSNGATLSSLIIENPNLQKQVAAFVLTSPNFKVKNSQADLAKLAYFDKWGPMLAGEWREWEPSNALHKEFWTNGYPTKSVVPMMRLIDHVERIDFSKAEIPAFFYYAMEDEVSDQNATEEVRAAWSAQTKYMSPSLGENVDPYAHVIAGDALSPANTEEAVRTMLEFIRSLED